MNTLPHSILHTLRIGIFVLMFLNLAYLNLLAVFKNHNSSFAEYNASIVEEKDDLSGKQCDEKCIEEIYADIYAATNSAKPQNNSLPIATGVKEHFVSFGSGGSSVEEWTDVGGLQAYIDTNKYPTIKKATLEASVFIPTGNQRAYVRLFNVTDKHPVWFSEVSLEGGEAQLLTSSPITLSEGNKLYSIQMKTSLKYETKLLQARVHIITE